MITTRHPYMLKRFLDYKDYVAQVRQNPINLPPKLRSRMSIPMQQLFDIILRMIAKD